METEETEGDQGPRATAPGARDAKPKPIHTPQAVIIVPENVRIATRVAEKIATMIGTEASADAETMMIGHLVVRETEIYSMSDLDGKEETAVIVSAETGENARGARLLRARGIRRLI